MPIMEKMEKKSHLQIRKSRHEMATADEEMMVSNYVRRYSYILFEFYYYKDSSQPFVIFSYVLANLHYNLLTSYLYRAYLLL